MGLRPRNVCVMGPMIRAASLHGFDPVVRSAGGDPDELLARFGIAPHSLDDDGLISITAHDLMLDAAARQLACPDLGLQLAEKQDLSILGPLALAIESSPTAAEALECTSRFMFVHSPALSIGLADDPGERRGVVALQYRKDLLESPYSPQAMELGLALFYRVATAMLGSSTGLRSVLFPHRPLSPINRYTEFFGLSGVRFGAPIAALCVEVHVLDAGFTGANELIRRTAVEHLAQLYPDPDTLVSVRVRRALAESLATGSPITVTRIARLLATHPRTLQRRLTNEGTSFARILDDVRHDIAHRHITSSDLPFTEIAALVGFAEQSRLSHAVRRWTGMSPRELRTSAVRQQHPPAAP